MKKKQLYTMAAVLSALGVAVATSLVSNANSSDIKEYTDQHGNRVIEFLNPVDPGNEPATMPDELPSNIGEVQGDLMTCDTPVVEEDTSNSIEVTDVVEEQDIAKEEVDTTQEECIKNDVQTVADGVITYTDKHGNKVTEFLNPVDPGNEPATIPDTVPSTQGNIQGNIMTLDEPIID